MFRDIISSKGDEVSATSFPMEGSTRSFVEDRCYPGSTWRWDTGKLLSDLGVAGGELSGIFALHTTVRLLGSFQFLNGLCVCAVAASRNM